ncbi:MAG: MoaD/ThiS family protein [Chloroflexi bacterium]|nr:MoaD/ThiS family protein [Chloroflexota bacterium]
MKVTVRLGEPFWRAAGQREVVLILASAITVAQALEVLARQYPSLAAELNNGEIKPALFINDEAASPESLLTDEATMHIVWPASGG